MRKIKLLAVFFIAIIATQSISAQSLENVLKDHFEAIGQKKLQKVESITTFGKINQSGIDIPFVQITARPNLFRVQGTFQGLTFIQTYNGTEGWTVNPFANTIEPEAIPADQLKELKVQADMDGILWNWKKKGYTATLDGTEDVEGTTCFKITVNVPDAGSYTSFIDNDSYMIIKTKTKTEMMGNDVESESFYSNYMQVDGIVFPGKIENRYNGVTSESILIESVVLDKEYENNIFDKEGTAIILE